MQYPPRRSQNLTRSPTCRDACKSRLTARVARVARHLEPKAILVQRTLQIYEVAKRQSATRLSSWPFMHPCAKSRSPPFYYIRCTCPLSHEFHQAATGVDDAMHAEYAYLLTSEAVGDVVCLYRRRDQTLGQLDASWAHLHNERGINGTQPSRLSEYKLLRHRSRLVSEQYKHCAVTMLYPFSLYFALAGTVVACAVPGTTSSDAPGRSQTPSDNLSAPRYGNGSCGTWA